MPYLPAPARAIAVMLRLARIGPGSLIVDLGSGEGEIAIAAARDCGARAVGYEIDPARVDAARANAEAAGVGHLVRFVRADLAEIDLTETDPACIDAALMFLLTAYNLALRPKLLAQLPVGARIVSYCWGMGDWEPEMTIPAGNWPVHCWTVPATRRLPVRPYIPVSCSK